MDSLASPPSASPRPTGLVCPLKAAYAFTLVELLVVIGIIALLISILLPSLNSARAAAQNVKCLANLRSIGQAMQLYASENKDAIPGAGLTSGRIFWTANVSLTNSTTLQTYTADATTGDITPVGSGSAFPTQGPIQPDDYIGPIAQILRLNLPASTNIKVRYTSYTTTPSFLCPSAIGVTSGPYPGSLDAGQLNILGYVTNANFLLTPALAANGAAFPGVTNFTRLNAAAGWTVPPQLPKLSRVKGSSEKIYIADGSKYFDGTSPIDYNLKIYPNPAAGGLLSSMFMDYGAWTVRSPTYDRSVANGNAAKKDGRLLSYRHGTHKSNAQYGAYRLNAGFFDGHAESLDEARATDVSLWLPRGTTITDSTQVWPDVKAKYNISNGYSVN